MVGARKIQKGEGRGAMGWQGEGMGVCEESKQFFSGATVLRKYSDAYFKAKK